MKNLSKNSNQPSRISLYRLIGSITLLLTGSLLIEKHQALWLTLLGMFLWAIFLAWNVAKPAVTQGFPLFSKTPLRQLNGFKEISWFFSLFIGLCVFIFLKIINQSLPHAEWWTVIFSLMALGGL